MLMQRARSVGAAAAEIERVEALAIGRITARAARANAAIIERYQYLVSGLDLGDGAADSLDHTRAFMAEDSRERRSQRARGGDDVGVADADGTNAHEYLVRPGLVDRDGIELERAVGLANQRGGGVHVVSR
jgi:hypothetical protein